MPGAAGLLRVQGQGCAAFGVESHRCSLSTRCSQGLRCGYSDDVEQRIEIQVQVMPDPDDGGFVSQIVGHPGIMSQGDTEREAVENAIDAFFCVASATLNIEVDHAPGDVEADSAHSHRVTIPA